MQHKVSLSYTKVVSNLRAIRDIAWQFGRQHEKFSELEKLAELSLATLGVVDGPPYPNPRTDKWWEKKS